MAVYFIRYPPLAALAAAESKGLIMKTIKNTMARATVMNLLAGGSRMPAIVGLLGLFLWQAGSAGLPDGCGGDANLGDSSVGVVDDTTGLRIVEQPDGETFYLGRLRGEEAYRQVRRFGDTDVFYEGTPRGVLALYEIGEYGELIPYSGEGAVGGHPDGGTTTDWPTVLQSVEAGNRANWRSPDGTLYEYNGVDQQNSFLAHATDWDGREFIVPLESTPEDNVYRVISTKTGSTLTDIFAYRRPGNQNLELFVRGLGGGDYIDEDYNNLVTYLMEDTQGHHWQGKTSVQKNKVSGLQGKLSSGSGLTGADKIWLASEFPDELNSIMYKRLGARPRNQPGQGSPGGNAPGSTPGNNDGNVVFVLPGSTDDDGSPPGASGGAAGQRTSLLWHNLGAPATGDGGSRPPIAPPPRRPPPAPPAGPRTPQLDDATVRLPRRRNPSESSSEDEEDVVDFLDRVHIRAPEKTTVPYTNITTMDQQSGINSGRSNTVPMQLNTVFSLGLGGETRPTPWLQYNQAGEQVLKLIHGSNVDWRLSPYFNRGILPSKGDGFFGVGFYTSHENIVARHYSKDASHKTIQLEIPVEDVYRYQFKFATISSGTNAHNGLFNSYKHYGYKEISSWRNELLNKYDAIWSSSMVKHGGNRIRFELLKFSDNGLVGSILNKHFFGQRLEVIERQIAEMKGLKLFLDSKSGSVPKKTRPQIQAIKGDIDNLIGKLGRNQRALQNNLRAIDSVLKTESNWAKFRRLSFQDLYSGDGLLQELPENVEDLYNRILNDVAALGLPG